MVTYLEPNILKCEVKWALGSITTNKASGGDGIPVELFQILKDEAVKLLHSVCQQIWKIQQWPQDWKSSGFILISNKVKSLSRVQLFATPWTVPTRLLCPWNFPGKSTRVGCHFLLQGIFPTQGSNPGLLHCRQLLYCPSHQRSPKILKQHDS